MDLVFKNKHDLAMSFEKHKTYLGGEVTKRIQEAKFEGYKPTKLRKGDVIVLCSFINIRDKQRKIM